MSDAPKPWDTITCEHWHVLAEVLGKPKARAFHCEIGKHYGCTYCGAKVGEACTTDAGAPAAGYQHKSRRDQARDEARRTMWELTHEIVEGRKASKAATERVSLPSAIPLGRPQLRRKIEVVLEEPVGVRLGLAVEHVRMLRARDERTWSELAELQAQLDDAEAEMRALAARIGIADPETLLAMEASE